ncbi:MAG: hypothetical protein ACYTAN_13810 [Planctomycetota bacterium]
MIGAPDRVPQREHRNRLRLIAETAVEEARADIGQGERQGNNVSRYIWALRGLSWPPVGRQTRGAWCAAAVFSWYDRAAASLGLRLPFERTHNARELARRIAACGRFVRSGDGWPLPGDAALWARKGSPLDLEARGAGHIGIVELSSIGARWRAIEGNAGRYPALVRTREHDYEEPQLIGWARIW